MADRPKCDICKKRDGFRRSFLVLRLPAELEFICEHDYQQLKSVLQTELIGLIQALKNKQKEAKE